MAVKLRRDDDNERAHSTQRELHETVGAGCGETGHEVNRGRRYGEASAGLGRGPQGM